MNIPIAPCAVVVVVPHQLCVFDRGNGFPSVGDHATDGSTVWRITDLCGGIIQCGSPASPNYIEVEAVDAGEPSDFEDEYDGMFEASRIVEGGAQ